MSSGTEIKFRLYASSLKDKYGFSDGGMFNPYGIENPRETLISIVKNYLLPHLNPNIEVIEVISSHNPIRAMEKTHWLIDDTIYVDVTLDQVRQISNTLLGLEWDAHKIAGKTLAEWKEFAKREDCLQHMTPSDLREILKRIKQ